MSIIDPIYVGDDALNELLAYCDSHGLTTFNLVADDNTYRAAGEQVEAGLKGRGWDVNTIILKGEEIIADPEYIVDVLMAAPIEARTYLAVGSGTLTDITRFASHRSRNSFISYPTAPSVDGFTSIGAPLVLRGVKQTVISQAPLAVFGDLNVLSSAPKALIAAGFGDLLGKITSVADWKIGALLWDEPFDDTIARRSVDAAMNCLDHADAIGRAEPEAVRRLMQGLIETGLCILDFGDSRPASGAEHHLSHYWEMLLLQEGRPAVLHGAKVGYATTLIAEKYEHMRGLDRADLLERLEGAELPDRAREVERIEMIYGEQAPGVLAIQQPLLDMTAERFDAMKHTIAERWDDLRAILATVPPAATLKERFKQAGTPISGADLGLSADEVTRAVEYGHYLRNRFTVRKLGYLFNLD